jgi:hypothetical protein
MRSRSGGDAVEQVFEAAARDIFVQALDAGCLVNDPRAIRVEVGQCVAQPGRSEAQIAGTVTGGFSARRLARRANFLSSNVSSVLQ